MKTKSGHLTYCTNIHSGNDWESHFSGLKEYFPAIKRRVSPTVPLGIGLRLSHVASIELMKEKSLEEFKTWLRKEEGYIFTLNGFPYGEFHNKTVKDYVHHPDWTTIERVDYTKRLFSILEAFLPEGMDGGVSTSPLSYRHWFPDSNALTRAKEDATMHILKVVEQLIQVRNNTEKILHLDIEPEPDGILETGQEFIAWYTEFLLPIGIPYITSLFKVSTSEAETLLKEHVRICYDVCHFALGYEVHRQVINNLKDLGIKIGKFQISAALKATIPEDTGNRERVIRAFSEFNEPTYLHQVIARTKEGDLIRYRDLPDALLDAENPAVEEWRAHFHVPVFLSQFGSLESTQGEIQEVLSIHGLESLTQHLEVETYTWDVLPSTLKLPIQQSIERELRWVLAQIGEQSEIEL